MDSRIAPLAEILRLNTVLFRNCLDGLSDEQAANTPDQCHEQRGVHRGASGKLALLSAETLGVEHPDPLARVSRRQKRD